MSSSAGRGQVEPLPALVAVSAVVAAIGLYAVAFHQVPTGPDRHVERRALTRVVESGSAGGVFDPEAVDAPAPTGFQQAVLVRAGDERWRDGPTPPADAATATTTVVVAAPNADRVGRVRVWVWR